MQKEHDLPPALLRAWIVDNHYDAATLRDIYLERSHAVPSIITYKFVTEMYSEDQLKKDPKADQNSILKLKGIDSTVTNMLIDYFNAHKRSKQFHDNLLHSYIHMHSSPILEVVVYKPADLDTMDYEEGITGSNIYNIMPPYMTNCI